MQCAVGANVGVDESIKNKSLIVRIFRKRGFPSGTTFKESTDYQINTEISAFLFLARESTKKEVPRTKLDVLTPL